MKLDSKLFDAIRIKPRREAKPEVEAPACAWEGCDRPGLYKAPKGHRLEGEYHNFCLEHVRHYNTAFNFFSGMSADDIETHVNETNATAGRPSRWRGSSGTIETCPFAQNLAEVNPKAIRLEIAHAFQAVALSDVAALAPDGRFDRAAHRPIRSVPARLSTGIRSNHRPAQRGRHVQRARIVRNHHVGTVEKRGELRQRRVAREVACRPLDK